jgi:hypothetical protein
MSACIRIESGISAGTSYWIDRPVLRIGSDPQCEISLPTAELAGHAMTLEFRNGTYRAYNRGTSPLSVGSAVIQSGGNALWQADEAAQLPGGVRLILEVDGDPRPSPRPDSLAADSILGTGQHAELAGDTVDTAATPQKKSSSTMVQLAVIGFCMLATVAFLTMKRGGGAPAAANRPTFDSIVKNALEKKNGVQRKVLPRLQFAQSAVVRGNSKLAQERFASLRDQLISQIDSLSAEDRKEAEIVLDYVEFQLGRLN